jgi:hypothetical protein
MDPKESKSRQTQDKSSKQEQKRLYQKPVLRSTEAFEKLALQSCAPEDKEVEGFCLEL